ncbi:MAG: hypothetical protein SFY68_04485 [Candidatus Sumerlaeia bacterium]|nr:hypothetical protein [Candidatus Sumerlaeia bacterium]
MTHFFSTLGKKALPAFLLFAIWLSYLILTLLLYYPVLDAFFLWDDISILSIATPLGEKSFWDCWQPLGNGFWRPIPLSISWLLVLSFGPSPFAFHLFPILLHSLNALLLRQVAIANSVGSKWGTLLGYLFIGNFAVFPAASMMQNCMDLLLGTGVLFTLLIVNAGKPDFPIRQFFAVFILTLACKETAVILPVIALLWLWGKSSEHSWEKLKIFLPRGLLMISWSFIALGFILTMQFSSRRSYAQEGMLDLQPTSIIRQFCDYILSLVFPYIHICEFPGNPVILSHQLLWMIRLSVIALLFVLVWQMLYNKKMIIFSLMMIVVCILLPACLLKGAPHGRFLYAALAPLFLLVGIGTTNASRMTQKIVLGLSLILLPISLVSFSYSPSVTSYVQSAKQVEIFLNESIRVSEDWPTDTEVAIYGHPHPGDNLTRWTYCQQLYQLFLPEKNASLLLDMVHPSTELVYRFEGGVLEKVQDDSLEGNEPNSE